MAAAKPKLRQELRKVVLVTGACGEIGTAICLRLARSRRKDPAFDDFKVSWLLSCRLLT
jgi:FlaA1/EpsC-like NDP-sugar epimerase